MLVDDGLTEMQMGHPLLLHFYVAHTLLLSNNLEKVRYFYDYARTAANIRKNGPVKNDYFPVYISKEKHINVKINNIINKYLEIDNELPVIYLPCAYPGYDRLLKAEPSIEIASDGSWTVVTNKSKDKKLSAD